ncbi:hypothetical protein [Saccharothrix variisporea]|uniref:Uncharacterized protein n=1 Tax=Saccharothrix variisporea TaxID=543527 RepID=A0A495XKN6_9PSEU|nr:hypothetical protein [Saccharothrix variisporea]RKT75040.1 hypothetical protein DFJ66_8417 [Saccharothrix variisporea]
MTYTRPRSGIFATIDGVEHVCNDYPSGDQVVVVSRDAENPNPTLFTRDETRGLWVARVPVDRCERLTDVTTRTTYQGRDCQVVGIAPNGDVGLYYLGDDKSEAAELGFVQVDQGTWAKTVDVHELGTLYEHHADLLFERWWHSTTP